MNKTFPFAANRLERFMVVWAISWSVSSWASVEASCMSGWNVICLGLAFRPSPSAAARPSLSRQRRESSRWGRRNASNRLENYPGRITKTNYKTSPGYSAIHTEADAKTNRKNESTAWSWRESTCTGQRKTDRKWSGWRHRSRCFTLRTATDHYDRAWVARSSGEALLRKERLFCFLVIVMGENSQVTPAVTHAVPRSDVTSQGQVSRIVRTGTFGVVSSRWVKSRDHVTWLGCQHLSFLLIKH